MDEEPLTLLRLLLARLERISADSYWAHRASGIRGALLRRFDEDRMIQQDESEQMKELVDYGFRILEAAARKKKG